MGKLNFFKTTVLSIGMMAVVSAAPVEAADRGTQIEIRNCNPKAASSFAIFTDAETFGQCRAEILAYQKVLEEEGLGTYVVSGKWENPRQVKEQIAKLAARKPILEGMVFIGEIPIVRVQKGQHLTTAFKMNEKTFPMNEASVPSDRFYDCPDLQFDFIAQDSVHKNWFYFNLSSAGSQRLSPAYYSARMVVPQELADATGKDKYEYLRNYLTKVAAAHREENRLDKFTYFAGNGYNSDCLTAWRQQSLVFRSYFPQAYQVSTGNTFLNFRQDPQMKFNLFSQMQNPQTDVFLFYEHGAPDTQYINGEYSAESLEGYVKGLKYELRNMYRRIKPAKKEDFVRDVCAHFGVAGEMFSPESMTAAAKEDSLLKANKDIHLEDLAALKLGSRVTILNACYNGSFHQKGYVAGYHIFNNGRTVVAQGNTVNVLQDKWAEQLIGILSLGARIGFWQKEVITLESHLIGDPTFRFSTPEVYADDPFVQQINRHLALSGKDTGLWKGMLESKDEMIRALAVKQLLKNYLLLDLSARNGSEYPQMISAIYNKDRSMAVRLQALYALSNCGGTMFTQAVAKGLSDPYEMIRRQSAYWAGKIGDPSLLGLLKERIAKDWEAQRVEYAAKSSLSSFADNRAVEVNSPKVMDELRRLRNYPNHPQIPNLLAILQNKNVDTQVRIVLCEALGWYECAANKNEIINCLEDQLALAKQNNLPADLKDEMTKTLKRLRLY